MNIIIADDSSFVRTIINKIISTEFPDAQIKLCTNGKEAFDAYMDINPDFLTGRSLNSNKISFEQFVQ